MALCRPKSLQKYEKAGPDRLILGEAVSTSLILYVVHKLQLSLAEAYISNSAPLT